MSNLDPEKFPQLTRMESVQEESQLIGEFIDWLGENGLTICTTQDGLRGPNYFPNLESTEQLLARRFEIDLAAVENERRAILAEHNKRHNKP